MYKIKLMLIVLLFAVMFVLIGCEDTTSAPSTPGTTSQEPTSSAPEIIPGSDTGDIQTWLQQIKNAELPTYQISQSAEGDELFEWGLGYLTYYGSIESTALDNLIFNAIEVHKRLATGEITTENLSENDQNLLDLTEGIEFNPDVDPLEQTGQTPEIRQAILDRITQDQSQLSPDEALNSNAVIGLIALPFPANIGEKYLVYTQETADSDFVFLGTVVVADAASGENRESWTNDTYSFAGWEDLPRLADASGPFWEDIPTGLSEDPTNTNEGRPGVLLISEQAYNEITGGNLN